jgi:murein DD-endopeptidase MepM/ murein hydrolase activator NlpD
LRSWILIAWSLAAFAQTPVGGVRQGQVLRVEDPTAVAARIAERTIKLFPQTQGAHLGLMPIPALEKPGRYKLEYLDAGGAVLKSESVVVLNAHFLTQNIVISKALSTLKPAPGEQETVNAFRTTVSDTRFWQEPFELPIPGCMTSPFGVRRLHNGKPTGDYHAGFDQRGAAGTPIKAITAGTVRIARQFNLRGGTVGLDHGQGLESIYMHMSKVAAVEGTTVKAGDIIGYVGSTGRSTAPHLHWTLYANGVPVNPSQWLKPPPCK